MKIIKPRLNLAIHTVFILKENILFLEEWINYHILLGFNKFYLYDNSKVIKSGYFDTKHKCFKPGKVNKYGFNYDKIVNMNDSEMNEYVKKLCEKYKSIEIINWSPTDKEGNILHNQKEAYEHCLEVLKRDNIDWCACIDMDEYIVINNDKKISDYINNIDNKTKCISLGQTRFESRFHNLDKLVTDIKKSIEWPREHSNKCIFNVKSVKKVFTPCWNPHNCIFTEGKKNFPKINSISFNHYNQNSDITFSYLDNIRIKVDNTKFLPLNNKSS